MPKPTKISALEMRLHKRLEAVTGGTYVDAGPGPFFKLLDGKVVMVVIRQKCPKCAKRHWVRVLTHPRTRKPLSKLFKK